MGCEQVITENLVSALIESASEDMRLAVEEIAPRKFDKVPKKSELAQLVEDCRHEGADSATSVIMGRAYKIARTLNEVLCDGFEPEPLARILAAQLRNVSDESRRVVWRILADELGRVKP